MKQESETTKENKIQN